MAAKDNASVSDIDKTSFWWAGLCAICHPGGGPTEFDRDGELYYDVATDQFGYEKLGLAAGQVALDGDYCEVSNKTGLRRDAPWDVTGVGEPDCLFCHRADRAVDGGASLNWVWRTATLRAKDGLQDGTGASVPAFAAAPTAAQGWFSDLALAAVPAGKPPMAATLDIDYQVGVDGGSLLMDEDGTLRLAPAAIASVPTDQACWGCHVTPDLKKRGRTWFDPAQDVHYAAFNRLHDADPANDVPPAESTACTTCHPAGLSHEIAKGGAILGSVRNDLDYEGFRTCRECHLGDSAERDPAAPAPTSPIHTARHLATMSCELCHIPYKEGPADLVVDNATSGATVGYKTADFLSDDPLDPRSPGDARWWPAFVDKMDADGVTRAFPVKLLLSAWWGDWDDAGTPELSDDLIRPIPLWRVRGALSTLGPSLVDDDANGKPELNTAAEIAAAIALLRGDDVHGNPVALEPVLVQGGLVHHDDGGGGVASFAYHGTGIATESSHPFSINHNVRPPAEALGAESCGECHRGMNGNAPTRVFDRLILVDPWDENGEPVYVPARELTELDPF